MRFHHEGEVVAPLFLTVFFFFQMRFHHEGEFLFLFIVDVFGRIQG